MQKILIIVTDYNDLRSPTIGWDREDGDLVAKGLCKNLDQEPRIIYDTPLRAIGEGWKLLAPPTPHPQKECTWRWWFTKD